MRSVLFVLGLAAFAAPVVADPSAGERAFQRCYACHSVVEGEDKLTGPNLRGVVGRRAGTLAGFAFSPAMIKAGERSLVWTRETLDAFIADPETFLPGTTMSMPSVKNAQERGEVIDYLEGRR